MVFPPGSPFTIQRVAFHAAVEAAFLKSEFIIYLIITLNLLYVNIGLLPLLLDEGDSSQPS